MCSIQYVKHKASIPNVILIGQQSRGTHRPNEMKVNAEDVAYSFALCFRLCRRWSMTHDASQRRPIAKLNAHIQWLSPSIIAALQQTDVFHATAQVDSVKSPLFITYTAPTYPPPHCPLLQYPRLTYPPSMSTPAISAIPCLLLCRPLKALC